MRLVLHRRQGRPARKPYRIPVGCRFGAPAGKGQVQNASGSADLGQDVQMTYSASFVPEVKVEARWNNASISKLPEFFRATASGSFTFDATLTYDAKASADYKIEKDLFRRSFTFRYLVAGVPVIQQVELKFVADLDFKAESPINLTKKFSVTKDVTYGFQWSSTSGFMPVHEDGFSKTDEFSLTGEATAKATISIHPVISTTFYDAARAELNLQGNVEVDAKAHLLPPPAEITKFDAKLWVDVWADADLTILGKLIDRWTSDKYTVLEVPLHSMPELALDYRGTHLDTCGTRQIYLRIADGYNNKVLPSSLQWTVDPPGPTLTVAPDGQSATFSSTTAGDYTVKVSGYGDGFLGALGTRRTSIQHLGGRRPRGRAAIRPTASRPGPTASSAAASTSPMACSLSRCRPRP